MASRIPPAVQPAATKPVSSAKKPFQLSRRGWAWSAFAIVILLLLGAGSWWLFRAAVPAQSQDEPLVLPPPPEVNPALIVTVLDRDSIRSIDDPQFEPASIAAAGIDPDERVIGLVINGEARAYPIPILSAHEIVNDLVGGEPVAITWCPLCYTALVFSRRVGGQLEPLTFGVSGKLLENTLVLYDRQTGSLWSQLYGGAIAGELTGSSLGVFPSLHTEWAAWQALHPDSQVLSKRLTCDQFDCGTYATNPRGSYDVDPYESYYNTPYEGIVNFQIPREAGAAERKARVLGVRVGGQARAYPFSILEKTALINDEISGVPVVVWFDLDTKTGAAYVRIAEERQLSFQADTKDPAILIDEQTGSQWQAATGEAISGPLRGTQLPGLVATSAFEFGWFGYFPQSEIYEPDTD
jgi:hypothetical protein